jgi:hypothetical protein
MNSTFNAAVAALIFAVGSAGSVAAGPYEDGTAAYEKGDYAMQQRCDCYALLPNRASLLLKTTLVSCTTRAMASRGTTRQQ